MITAVREKRKTCLLHRKNFRILLHGAETALLCKLGFTQLYQGKTMYIDVDVHMNTQPNYNVNVHTIAPLGEAY